MQVTRLPAEASAADASLAIRLMDAIGANNFAADVIDCMAPLLPVSHCTVFGLRSNGRMEAVASASAVGEIASITAVEYLRMGFDRQDSNTRWLLKRKPGKRRQFWLGHQFATEVQDAKYRRICYEEPGIRERASLLSVSPDGYRVSLSLYRNHAYPDFDAQDLAWLAQQAPLVVAALMRHVQLAPRSVVRDGTERELMATLSARERQVIAHVMAGMSTKEAALEMGVSLTTAWTYRYRAFQHLGIRSQRELFALLRRSQA